MVPESACVQSTCTIARLFIFFKAAVLRGQELLSTTCSVRRRGSQRRRPVDASHGAGLAGPVIMVVLDDAEGVDLDKGDLQCAVEQDGVYDIGREAGEGRSLEAGLDISGYGA